ncbi:MULTISPECIES: hypothetical protein [unclassified Pseudomonas]|uniref:hypothetical protein n=1 Tax=unclassified Pseudomonas TaxID=196821 RepID=UPI000876FFBF|nr:MULTISPECIES: hypothetical protein [unclassified Pseudomonas]SCZ22868.1 hypothetical protein SAMN03159405_00909 [Pseudomonas sp. NFACC44-2]SDA52616.1 hypothetical protein SAMN03159429_01227 [Pseudomonas sp. NFACC51]SEJ07595.1 hypothetical protein SAMN03159298_02127 [Pseudomonas sp. NFACC07-1]SFH23904.1 hypothetical protein SAMN03159302_00907 [Pseudomonas sp. NFACC54]SFS98675.1 hypothetical protein SAMN03159306_03027 [Pseudomonas sp. NFACC48-1]
MRESIKVTLQAWVSQLEAQRVADAEYAEDDVFLDYKVLGAATFLKQIAYEQDDMELLAIASKAEIQVKRLIEAEDEAERERLCMQEEEYEADQRIREICIHHFFIEPAFSVDMSKYEAMIEASAAGFSDPHKLASLKKYVDTAQVLNKIYDKVKSRLRRASALNGGLPTFEEVLRAFEAELQEIYRLADAHVPKVIIRHAEAQA